MEQNDANDNILLLDNALIFNSEPGGESAIGFEQDVLLLSNALAPEPVVKKIEVGPRISRFELAAAQTGHNRTTDPENALGWNILKSSPKDSGMGEQPQHALVTAPLSSVDAPSQRASNEAAKPESDATRLVDLVQLLAEAQAFANEYGAMNARTRSALYATLERTYDLTFFADSQPDAWSRLIDEAGLKVQDRAPYTPIIKLVFGADYDKTRITEFAAAIAYGRRKNVAVGSFSAFIDAFDGGLKAMVALERMMRKGDYDNNTDSVQIEARPAIVDKLRKISLQNLDDLSSEGDEFALLMARRLPDGSIAVLGEVPHNIALLEKAARTFLANAGRTDEAETR
ncbi:MAG: hypothetical protein IPG54_05115 [Sphingomonadales bacterium]|jgi:hypothetical protein|nr:hypothetical protein [Sphingomonadales bacterium]MBK9268064.1 hypothetical protein [Sphingomonadales bacterium]